MSIIKTTGLVREYVIGQNITRAINGVDLEVKKGEFIAITGKSGSGKSTLLYQLSLLDQPTSGVVYVQGEDTTSFTNKERTERRLNLFGYVFQDYALVPELNAIENVLIPLMMQGYTRASCFAGAKEMLEKVGLGDKLNNLPSQLSGGEQQRVSIARALVNNPQVLFADEPTANLDSHTSGMIMDTLTDLNATGLTIVMVTHEKEYAGKAQRIIELRDGVIVD